MIRRALVRRLATLLAAAVLAAPDVRGQVAGGAEPAPVDRHEPAARAGDTTLSWDELDRLLLDRHAMSEDGRGALKHLVQSHVLDRLADERGIEVSESRLDARWSELDGEMKAAGEAGIEALLQRGRIAPAEFRRYLRLAIVQETLTRRALGLADDAPLTGEQQQMWLDEVLRERGYEEIPPPWSGAQAAVARSGDLTVRLDDYVGHLRQSLSAKDMRDACYQLLLEKRMAARMPDLAPEVLDRAITEEIERRRAEAERDPKHQGVSYEMLLQAKGLRLDALRRDPVIQVAALSRLWVERAYDEETLRRIYADEREHFDGRYGEAVELSLLFLRGARFENDLNPRSFEEAEAELAKLGADVRGPEDFERLVRKRSEDAHTREDGGALGFVTRADERVPREVREAAFAVAPPADKSSRARLIGPVRVSGGCVLLWLGERRPAPTWDRMELQVKGELRKRFIEEVLPEDGVVTWMDLD